MIEVHLRFVVSDTDRHGNIRYYFRRKGQNKIRLRGALGSREFISCYKEALEKVGEPNRKANKDPSSFGFLCNAYFNSAEFRSLHASTQSWRRRELTKICSQHGDKPFGMLSAGVVRRLVDERADHPGAARNRLKSLKALFRWAVDREFAPVDPTQGVKPIRNVSDGHHTWTPDEVQTFERCFGIGTKARLALALLLYTACRRGDVIRLGPQNIRSDRIKMPKEILSISIFLSTQN